MPMVSDSNDDLAKTLGLGLMKEYLTYEVVLTLTLQTRYFTISIDFRRQSINRYF